MTCYGWGFRESSRAKAERTASDRQGFGHSKTCHHTGTKEKYPDGTDSQYPAHKALAEVPEYPKFPADQPEENQYP